MLAAFTAAACTSRGELEAGRGSEEASSGKLRMAEEPFIVSAAASCARAAISAVAKVPSQILFFFRGSRISETHFPHVRILTPLYTGCLLLLLLLLLLSFLRRFLELNDDSGGDDGDDNDNDNDDNDEDGEIRFALVVVTLSELTGSTIVKGIESFLKFLEFLFGFRTTLE